VALRPYEYDEDRCGDNDVESEESADTRGKKFLEKQRKVQAMCRDPWKKLRVRQDPAYDAQAKITMTEFHQSLASGEKIERHGGDEN
jgi:hypothetical protein